MQRWRYIHAIYEGGVIAPHKEWEGVPIQDSLGPFLEQAGQQGWELCGVLPMPAKDETGTGLAAPSFAVIFKQPTNS
jgi:hypothetical protein